MIISDQKVSLIQRELINGSSNLAHIASKVGVSRPTVRRYSKILGYHKGNKVRLKEHTLDLTYFKSINTPEKAYVLGLIYADGCNTRKGLNISLQEQDKKVVEFVKDQLKVSNNLRFVPAPRSTWSNKWELTISSMELSKQLTQVGCHPAKSLTIKFPDFISENLLSHFIRGYFDGDGSLSKNQGSYRLSIVSCSPVFLQVLSNHLDSIVGEHIPIYRNNSISTSKTFVIRSLIQYMYKDATFSMERKQSKALDFMRERGGRIL